ncbi:MAG: hypothetical protein QW273_01580 [Candidatus Pacearchaeota archaeon]
MKPFVYFEGNKKKKINVIVCDSLFKKIRGLMFKKNSLPLLFILDKEKTFFIHSFFCRPFEAIWLDNKKRVIKKELVKPYTPIIKGKGKYLIERLISSF